jgi:3-hydroxy-9,10-secoandrosta-1,3,5(10)-triene-9,17-dione monooxygenase
LTAAVLGAAAGFLEAFIESGRDRNSGMGIKLVEDPYCLQAVAEASYTIKSATLAFLNDCDEMMKTAEADIPFGLERRAELRYNATRSAQVAAHAVERLFEQGGGRAIFFDHPLQRRYQDVKGMMHHTAMNPNPSAKLYGSAQFGIPIFDMFL